MPTLPKRNNRSWIPKPSVNIRQVDNSSFYHSRAWRMCRKLYIKSHPLCEQCTREGRTTSAQMCDHIRPITLGGLKLDTSNIQSLCNKCHAKKSALESVEYRRGIKEYIRK